MSAFSLPRTVPTCAEAMPTNLLDELLIGDTDAATAQARVPDSLPAKIYAVMAVTTLLTFVTLRTGYEILFAHQLFG